jgi:hypothetical protein
MAYTQKDIYKIAVSIVMIHICIILVFSGAELGFNPTDNEIQQKLSDFIDQTDGVGTQIPEAGLCLQGTTSQSECESHGCIWENNQCYNAVEKTTGVDFGFFDVLLSIMKIPLYLGKFLVFVGSVVFYEAIISVKVFPLVNNFVGKWILGLILWVYQMVVLYYIWAFISNWRGIITK